MYSSWMNGGYFTVDKMLQLLLNEGISGSFYITWGGLKGLKDI